MTDDAKHTPDAAAPANVPVLQVDAVVKRFGGFTAVNRLSLDITAGEFFALLGPSGCGKTTLLRMLAGFETPDAGRILLDGQDIAGVPPHQRPINMMFQNYALFPHLSVQDNIAFGLRRASLPRAEIASRVAEMVALLKLEDMERRKPDQLSGGQRQRVALARALARRPRLLLLDEPLAALDKKLRENTQAELMRLQRQLGMTFIIVTHDQEEAMMMADRIGVMNEGRLEQVATPRQLYEAPNSRWIAEFVGGINIIDGEVESRDAGCMTVATQAAGRVTAAAPLQALKTDQVCVAIRPEKVRLSRGEATPDASHAAGINRMEGVIAGISYLGGQTRYQVRLDHGALLHASVANTVRLEAEAYDTTQRVVACFAPDDCMVLDR